MKKWFAMLLVLLLMAAIVPGALAAEEKLPYHSWLTRGDLNRLSFISSEDEGLWLIPYDKTIGLDLEIVYPGSYYYPINLGDGDYYMYQIYLASAKEAVKRAVDESLSNGGLDAYTSQRGFTAIPDNDDGEIACTKDVTYAIYRVKRHVVATSFEESKAEKAIRVTERADMELVGTFTPTYGLVSCDYKWKHNETQHWMECFCGQTEFLSGHIYSDGSDATCNTTGCGYERALYSVTVEGGNGSGSYAEGAVVTVSANVPKGYTFVNWSSEDSVSFTDASLPQTTFTMPAGAVTVLATFIHACDDYIEPVAGQAPGCDEDGWKGYYQCTICETMYTGVDGTIKITDLDAWKNGDGKLLAAHSPAYTANGNVITESCSACTVELGTVTILAKDATYTGAPYEEGTYINVKATGTLKERNWPISYIATSGSLSNGKPVNAGSYSATIAVEESGTPLSARDDFTITPVFIEDATVTVADTCIYNGMEHRPDNLTVTTGYGSSLSAGNYEIVGYSNNINAGSNATITISGKGNYTGEATGKFSIEKAKPTTADFAMTPPENLYYTGEAKAATVAAANGVTGMGAITVRYSPENPVNEGSYDVLIDVAEGDNYAAISGLNVGSFTIGQSGSAFSGVKTYLGSNEEDEFTYGQLITVKGNVQATGKAPAKASRLLRAFTAPAAKQVALFDETGTKQLSAAAAVEDDGAFMLIYDTISKLVDPAKSVTLMVKFVGDNNMANASTTVAIRLNACPVAPALSGAVTKPYDGTTAVPAGHGLSIQLDGLQSSDSVSASGSFAYADASAGTGKTVIASGIALDGPLTKFYALSADTASSACGEITKAQAIPMSGTTHVINNHAQTYEIDLSQHLPALDDGKTFGSVSYALDRVELGSYYDGGAAISGSALSLPISAVDSDEEKTAGAVTVTVSSQNYADSTLTLAVSTTNHQHQWNFTGSGDTITAACSNEDGACTVLQVTIRLVAPTDEELAYTGTAKTVTIEQTPAGMFGDLPAVRYCHADGCIGVGEHTATLTYRGATAEKKFTIGPVDAADAGGDAEIVDGTTLIVTKDTRLPDSAAYYGEAAKTALEEKFGAANTVVKIEVHMQEAGEAALAAMSNVDTDAAKVEVLEISLKYWDEPSGKWVKITEETLDLVPGHGVEVVIPYDLFGFTDVENFNQYRFVVQHMITLPMDDAYQIGDIEDLSGETVATPEGLKIHVEHGFSPFVVGYAKVVDQAAIGALPQTGDNSQLGLWLAMLALCGAGVLTLRRKVQN